MPFKAVTIGSAFPRARFDGRVHSLFERACNVRLDGGALITFLVSDQLDAPQGARLEFSSRPVFDGLRIAQRVVCRSGIARFEGSDTVIDLRQAGTYCGDVASLRVDMSRPVTVEAWQAAWNALCSFPAADGLGIFSSDRNAASGLRAGAPGRRIDASIHALLLATRRLDVDGAVSAAEGLIGLGPGLTPLGDDFLAGYLAGLWCASQAASPAFAQAFGRRISALATKTTLVSRVYLEHAAQGRVSSALFDLARAMNRDLPAVRQAVHRALNVGDTSGAGGVLGLLLGLHVCTQMLSSTVGRFPCAPQIGGYGKPPYVQADMSCVHTPASST